MYQKKFQLTSQKVFFLSCLFILFTISSGTFSYFSLKYPKKSNNTNNSREESVTHAKIGASDFGTVPGLLSAWGSEGVIVTKHKFSVSLTCLQLYKCTLFCENPVQLDEVRLQLIKASKRLLNPPFVEDVGMGSFAG